MSQPPPTPARAAPPPDVRRRRCPPPPRPGVLALVLLGVGVVALRDTAVALQWLHGTPWIDAVIYRIDGMSSRGG